MILNKRIKRDFFDNKLRNISMTAIIAFSIMLVVSLCSSTDAITHSMENMWNLCNVEDGSFETYVPLSRRDFNELSELDILTEQAFYSDIELSNGGIMRVFQSRNHIDLPYVEYGRLPVYDDELFLEKKYAENHNISVGDSIYAGGRYIFVCGTGCLPDYGYVKQNSSDVATNDEFGISIMTKGGFENITRGKKLIYHYKFLLGDGVYAKDLKKKLEHLKFNASDVKDTYIKAQLEKGAGYSFVNISSFEDAKYNIRIHDPVDDSQISKKSALVAGIILLLLLSYMLAIFASGTIEQERTVIGTLYALGYSRRELLRHYTGVPMVITVTGAAIGVVLGYAFTMSMAASSLSLYSVPDVHRVYRPYLLCYALGMPLFMSAAINGIVLAKKLNTTPMEMMRKSPDKNARKSVILGNMSFGAKFRIRQFLREIKGNLALLAGVMISLLLIMFSVACYGSLKGYIDGVVQDINYNYMYILRNPVEDLPKNSHIGFVKGFYTDFPMTKSEMEITLLGIDRDNPYFDFAAYMGDESNKVYISSSARIKFGYKKGDKIILKDNSTDRFYSFEIADEVKYDSGLYMFMNIDAMRKAFDLPYYDEEDFEEWERRPKSEHYYYNAVFSDKRISFKHNMMLSETAKADMKRGADKFMTLMFDMIVMLIGVSVLIFVAVMYLLMKLETDRSRTAISLLKALGYSRKEVNSFYIGNSFYVTLAAVILGIPICKKLVDIIYPFAVSNVNAGFEATVSPPHYVLIVILVFSSYFLTRIMLVRYLDKVNLSEILKNRD